MGFIKNQFLDVVEWEEWDDQMIFWKWTNREIKKNSKLIIKPGQDAIFLFNGKVEGVFTEDGDYDIQSEIIPFLSTLKGFKFGFNSGMRAEVLFVNTKQFVVKWGTKSPINIPTLNLPGGMPIRANGTFNIQLNPDAYQQLIETIAGVKNMFTIEDVKLRITAYLDQLLMKCISTEGKDMFNLQANADAIGASMCNSLNQKVQPDGFIVSDFQIMNFTYPEEIQEMITKNAAQSMVGDVGRYQQLSMTDAMANGNLSGGSTAGDMAGMMMGMQIAGQMMNQMNQTTNNGGMNSSQPTAPNSAIPNFCPNCGAKTNGNNFCGNCGTKLV